MKKRHLPIVILTLMVTSCTTQHNLTTKTTDIYGVGVVQKPVIAARHILKVCKLIKRLFKEQYNKAKDLEFMSAINYH